MGGSINAYVQNVTYTAFSQVAQEEIGTSSNAYITSTYDPHTGNLTDSQTENPAVSSTPFDDTSYTYDPAGNITAQADTRNGTQSETQCFGYDTLDRLAQAWTATDNCAASPSGNSGSTVGDQISGGAYWTTWKYDPLGNQTTQTQHSLSGGTDTATSYTYNGNGTAQPNTLTSSSTTGPSGSATAGYTYDPDGNTLTRNLPSGKQTLTWTHDGKLATDTTSAGTTSYIYDAGGGLLLQKDPGQTTAYLFGGAQQLVLNTGTSAVTGTRFLQLPGGGVAVRTGAGTAYSFEITDQHGTSLLTLDNTAANPAWRQYTPYGASRGTAPSSWPDTHAFLGKPADTATGLDIIGARQYDPATGRFLSVDPILDTSSPQTFAGYAYAAGNPVTSSDPTGLCRKSMPDEPPVDCSGNPVGGVGGNSGGPGPGPGPGTGSGCDPFIQLCGPSAGGGNQTGPGPSPVPDVHPVAARYAAAQAGSVYGPGCNPMLFKYGACPSERGAAGTTPQQVKNSALGALGVLLGALPIGDLLDLAIGSIEESGAGAGLLSGSVLARSGLNAEQRVEQNIGVGRNVGVGRTTIPGSGPGGFRVPDFNPTLTIAARGSVVEVKDVARLSATSQLRDLVSYAQGQGVPLEIFTNANLPSSGELFSWIQSGQVTISPIP
jgi:RHS repeat-associated protein